MLKNFLERLLEDEDNEIETRVGRVSEEAANRLEKTTDEHEAAHEEIKNKVEAYLEELKAAHDCEAFAKSKADAWEAIYDELGLTQEERGLRYRISHVSRVISRIDEVEVEVDEKAERPFLN